MPVENPFAECSTCSNPIYFWGNVHWLHRNGIKECSGSKPGVAAPKGATVPRVGTCSRHLGVHLEHRYTSQSLYGESCLTFITAPDRYAEGEGKIIGQELVRTIQERHEAQMEVRRLGIVTDFLQKRGDAWMDEAERRKIDLEDCRTAYQNLDRGYASYVRSSMYEHRELRQRLAATLAKSDEPTDRKDS